MGLWKRAAADYAKAMELGGAVTSPAWWGIPQLFLHVGDETSYQLACERLLQQQDQLTDPFVSMGRIRSCAISPIPLTDPKNLAERAENLLTTMPGRPGGFRPFGEGPPGPRPGPKEGPGFNGDKSRRPPWPGSMRWPPIPRGPNFYLAGLAHYRAGDYSRAIQRLREASAEQGMAPIQTLAQVVLAMSYMQQGQTEKAKQTLVDFEKKLSAWTETMVQGKVGNLPAPWFDWLECLILHQEARWLITGTVTPTDPRLKTIRQRALEAIKQPES